MQRTIGSGPKRLIGGLIAVALLLGGFGIFFDDVQAASSVTPQSGPRGNNVVGTHKGESRQLATMLFQVDLNSSPSFMFCIDISTVIEFGGVVRREELGHLERPEPRPTSRASCRKPTRPKPSIRWRSPPHSRPSGTSPTGSSSR
jgi:hypothetical protein